MLTCFIAALLPGVCGRQVPDTVGEGVDEGRHPAGPGVCEQSRTWG